MTRVPAVKNDLERKSDDFYSRLSPDEVRIVKSTVKGLEDFMRENCGTAYLIAGCGSVLRSDHSGLAKDIDLAVVGFKYSPAGTKHTFNDVISFTKSVQGYFARTLENLKTSGTEFSTFEIKGGSGPFSRVNEGINTTLDGVSLEVRTELEDFGWYNSKGLQIKPEHTRPIDVQFVFNRTPAEWIEEQASLTDSPESRAKHVGEPFYYAPLAYA